MKRGGVLLGCLLLLVLSAPTALFADQTTIDLRSIVLENFEPGPDHHDWTAQGNQYITPGFPKTAYANTWPEALNGANPPNASQLQALGVNAQFDRQGYNRVDIFPYRKDASGNIVSDPIQIPGRVRTLDLWVWGSNHDFTLDVELQDYEGVDYVLSLGSLDYAGWKDLMVTIPPSIPQEVNTIPRLRGLKLVKFMIWSRPRGNVSNFFVYFDQIKVLTDMFETRIDGERLANPAEVQKIWGNPQQGSKP